VTPAARTDSRSSSRLVLIVEDDTDTREMYGAFLGYYGFEIAEARSGIEALALAWSLRPDVITTDVGLGGAIDGCQLTEILKSSAETQQIPVVAVTGWATGPYVDRARRAQCDAVLVKPCLPQDLLATIERLLAIPVLPEPNNQT
jgi:two-component system cell cycle response regulator DivK